MEEDVQELGGCEDEQQTNAQGDPQAARNLQQQQNTSLPARQTLQAAHPQYSASFIPLSSLPARQLTSFSLSTGAINVPSSTAAKLEELSPSAKRGKYAGLALQSWPPPLQMNVNLSGTRPLSPANPIFSHTLAALSPGPSSASASSFSQSSSPGSAQPATSAVMIMAPSGSGPPTGLLAPAASPAASHSPSHSLIPTASSAGYNPTSEPNIQESADAQPPATSNTTRKGKFVSPVWKPQEMLSLAKAWRLQYCGTESNTGALVGDSSGLVHKAKTRAEKDVEVADYLKQHGVQRDVKTAATKWDNMLGDFRKVNEWEKTADAHRHATSGIHLGGKSYFRLTSAERKLHRLPASFDEEVYEEMAKFIGQRPARSTATGHLQALPNIRASAPISSANLGVLATRHNINTGAPAADSLAQLDSITTPPAAAGTASTSYRPAMQGADHPLLIMSEQELVRTPMASASASAHHHVGVQLQLNRGGVHAGGMGVTLQRVGRIKMVWEESVHIWGPPEAQQGRLKVDNLNLNFLQADQLAFLDHNISANAIEAFESGPLQGFSTDTFTSGQQLKVFGRRGGAPAPTSTSGTCSLHFLPL
ncbi:hypothetical protein GOP47_0028359 [Adiantum capillus-veneris]|nr:hypothetical protein GOP47_0028359 [Adiantum capillus-veneris]